MIAVLSGGSIVETGKHQELISRRGFYYDLVQAQKGKKKEEPPDILSEVGRDDHVGDIVPTNSKTSFETDDLINFHQVDFKYPSRPEQKIFEGLEMSVKRGETLAIVGPSGQGKSTVIQLIEQFYRPDGGQILYNGGRMTDINVAWLRNQMALVAQEPVLFDISVRDNIRFGLEYVTQDEIVKVAKEANCHDFIMGFPDGYDTIVGSAATSQVSGGQKQRIAIARALLRDPELLLLDEATSALDSESERVVQDALDKITSNKKRTIVQIAHRLSTIRNSDRIIVLNNGKGAEAEQRMYMGEDMDTGDDDGKSSGIIVIESLSNIRTVASLSLEDARSKQYAVALHNEDPTPVKSNWIKGLWTGIGPLFQQLSFALLFWWGGWLIANFPRLYTSRGFLISMFSLLFSLSGLAAAAQGATDRTKALAAAERTFDLIERKSEIDPLSTKGKEIV
eukprot:jgi/Psemu1/325283/estExt_fgenesh1_pg.C_2200020